MALLLLPVGVKGQDLHVGSDKKGRLGYFDEDGKEVISCKYEEAEEFRHGTARVMEDGEYSIIDTRGKRIGGKYTVMIEYANTEFYLVADGGKDLKPGDKQEKSKLAQAFSFSTNTLKKGSRAGMNTKVFKGSTEHMLKGAKWGLIDRQGREVIDVEYDELSDPVDGCIFVKKGDKYGFYDEHFNLVVKPAYKDIGRFNNLGLCWVSNGSKMGVIDRHGQFVIPLKYKYVSTFAPAEADDDAAFARQVLEVSRMEESLDEPSKFFDGEIVALAEKRLNELELRDSILKTTFSTDTYTKLFNIDNAERSSKKIGAVKFGHLEPMPDSDVPYLWCAQKGVTWSTGLPGNISVVDVHGRDICPAKRYSEVYKPTDGMMLFCISDKKGKNKQYGFYNIDTGKEVLLDQGDKCHPFRQGLCLIERGEPATMYYVDKDLRPVSDYYEQAFSFAEGYSVVKSGGKFGAINTLGEVVVPIKYDTANGFFSEGLLGVGSEDTGVGAVDAAGKTRIPMKYHTIYPFLNGRALVKNGNGKWGIIDKEGKEVLPAKWNDLRFSSSTLLNSDHMWVKDSDNLFYYYDLRSQKILFPGSGQGYVDAEAFDREGHAIVRGEGATYGAIGPDGTVCVPIQFERHNVGKAYMYMKKHQLKVMRPVDVRRFQIVLRGTMNTYGLFSTVPENEWDF